MSLQSFVEAYGYWAILVGTFLEGETILLLAGFAAQIGYLELPWVMAAAFAGSFSGDQLYFFLGRRYGNRIIAKRLSWQANADRVYRILERHQNILILTFRFYYGLRNVTPFVIGASRVERVRFVVLNAIGAVVWAVALAYAGYLFGEAVQLFFHNLARMELYVFAGLAVAAVLVWIVGLMRRRRRARQKQARGE